MNKEEKEAIEELRKQYRLSINVDCITTDIRNKYAKIVLNLIQKQENEINKLKETLNDRVDVMQTVDSISFIIPSKVAAESMKVLDESALAIENKRLCELLKKQEKIIDMAMELISRKVGSRIEICPDMNCCKETEGNRTCKQCAIEYFKKEVEKECEK